MKFSPVILMIITCSTACAQQPTPQFGKDPVRQVIAAMTLEEKVKILVGMGFKFPAPPVSKPDNANVKKDSATKTAFAEVKKDSVTKEGFAIPQMDSTDAATPEKVMGAAGRTHAIPRLGIPSMTVSDGPAGVHINPYRGGDSSRSYYATAYPVGTLLASSWDTALVRRVGTALGSEVKDYGVDIILGPGMNIQRSPLGGRNFEYFSEDPLLSGRIAAAMVEGVQSNGVGTTIKHFAANNGESNRTMINTIVSERALREIYLKNFQIAVQESAPWAIMTSYNKINGVYTSQSAALLDTILRNEWGFKGFVMSDWGGGKNAVDQVSAENDLLMPGNVDQTKSILSAVRSGALDIKMLDRNVENILNTTLLSGSYKQYQYSNTPDLKTNAGITRSAAAESMVLLKNENTLPLSGRKSVALFGNAAYELIAGGSGSGDVNKSYKVSLEKGLTGVGFTINEKLAANYKTYLKEKIATWPKPKTFLDHVSPIPDMTCEKALIDQSAKENDMAIYTIGRNSGEGLDRTVSNDFDLTPDEKTMVSEIAEAFHKKGKKFVIVLNIGGVVETASWRDEADAILLAWQPGMEGGNSITDVLTGKQNPSGKLAVSFPLKYDDVPSAKNFPGRELDPFAKDKPKGDRASEIIYEDGIYVGYRYYQSFHVKTAYPFGYGLSYTKFTYTNLSLSSAIFNDQITATVTVSNAGNVEGKEVVELYLSAPDTKIDKPEEELKGFVKTRSLKPGESQTVQIVLDASSLASFHTDLTRWVADAGTYHVRIGAGAEDIRLTKDFTLNKEILLPRLHKVLTPQVEIKEIKP